MLLAFIPSPSRGVINLGPFELHAYGLMLAIGVLVAAWITEKRWTQWGRPGKEIGEIFIPVVIGGVVGARVYHLFTGYSWRSEGLAGTVKIWQGGLSIWGVIAGGAIAVYIVGRVKHLDLFMLYDAIVPGLVVAQAIGRWGNYFNQELYGRPTRLPWGLEIDLAHRPAKYINSATFHPTFLYESIWCLLVAGAIIWAERRRGLHRGQALAMYLSLYTFGRTFFEWLRVDPASEIFGIRFNLLLSAVVCIGSALWFVWLGRHEPWAVSARVHGLAPPADDDLEPAAPTADARAADVPQPEAPTPDADAGAI
jgi:phosphatidylglycerol---prolipoprotein diacylglyceryl transferase